MTIRQAYVPYRQGYNIGVGADFATGSPMGKAVDGVATKVEGAGAATVQFNVRRIQSTEELEQSLGIDAESSLGCSIFGGGISARFSFAKATKVQSSSLFMLVSAQVELAFESVDEPVLTSDADLLLEHPDIFGERYGDAFVRGVQRGGLFIGTLQIDTASAQQSSQIAGELAGSYGLFSADVQTKFASIQSRYNCSVFVNMYHEGGPVDLHITDFTNPHELLENANAFLSSFKTQPEEQVAKPYFVTLAPMAIARSKNLPPNNEDVEHAQGVLMACTKARSRILDQINLVEYILANPDKFNFPATCTPDTLAKLQALFESDIDTVSRCASAAIDVPKGALMPADYAKGVSIQYPQGVLPLDMPLPKAGKLTLVPDFNACASWVDCNALAASKGLTAQQVFANLDPDTFKVISVSPAPGTPVSEGSVVNITTQRTKVTFVGSNGGPIFIPWMRNIPPNYTPVLQPNP